MQYDVIINGGGMTGAAIALALADFNLHVAVLEARQPIAFDSSQRMDLRVSAINLASEKLLRSLNAWQHIEKMRSAVFNRLEVWEHLSSKTCFDKDLIKQTHLGHIIENRVVQLALWQEIEQKQNIELITEAALESIAKVSLTKVSTEKQKDGWQLSLSNGQEITTTLLIGTDGAQSKVRQLLKIGNQGWNYRQHALVIGINTDFPQQDVTWQQMTESGPRAFLPLSGNKASLVWYDNAEKIAQLKQLSNEQIKSCIIDEFPPLQGDFSVERFASFPLTRMHANSYVADSAIILGDAAHTINPLAGQGVNLGFKDVSVFSQLIAKAIKSGKAINDSHTLKQYERKRRSDNLVMMSAMDVLYKTFSSEMTPARVLRSFALFGAEKITPLKSLALKYATGLAG